ncbi:MAG: DUF1223 domain-containing protein [Bacteroidota bacterium]
MKRLVAIFTLLAFVLLLWNFMPVEVQEDNIALEEAGNIAPFVVVELFTSQGCSSCPPADRLLTEISQEAKRKGVNVFPLSFHVAYWNYLGWKDPFSKEIFSERQRNYAKSLRSSVYTPQMVFNGKDECVGSKKGEVEKHVAKILQKSGKANISIESEFINTQNGIKINYSIGDNIDKTLLNFALVERDLEIFVKRGENGGRNLKHDNVVKEFKTISLKNSVNRGVVVLPIPANLNLEKSAVIAYLQKIDTKEIYGATILELENKQIPK